MNKYLIKISNKSEQGAGPGIEKKASSNKKSSGKKLSEAEMWASAGAIGLGSLAVDSQYRKGNLTGRKILYHGTDSDTAKKIRDTGLLPQSSTGSKNGATSFLADVNPAVGNRLLEKNKGLVFMGKKRGTAAQYAFQNSLLTGKSPGMVRVSAPTWSDKKTFKKVPNPEVADSLKRTPGILHPYIKREYGTNVFTNKGSIPTKYISGSKDYKRLTAKEVKEFISKNKKRAAKGYGKAAIGTGLVAAGSGKIIGHYRKDNSGTEKKASVTQISALRRLAQKKKTNPILARAFENAHAKAKIYK